MLSRLGPAIVWFLIFGCIAFLVLITVSFVIPDFSDLSMKQGVGVVGWLGFLFGMVYNNIPNLPK